MVLGDSLNSIAESIILCKEQSEVVLGNILIFPDGSKVVLEIEISGFIS